MNSKVFGSGYYLEISRIIPLQPLYKSLPQLAGEVRIFAIGLVAAPPAGVAKNIDIGRPKRQPLIQTSLSPADKLVVLGTCFIGCNHPYLLDQLSIPGSRHTDSLRKNRCVASPGNAVQTLVPPVVGRKGKALDARSIV